MVDIVIEKIEQLEGVVQITAAVIAPYYYREDKQQDEDKEALQLHYQHQTEYKRLHLGNATLSQRAVE
ncbi:hypothetical protein ES703_122047 [subsurface metagenome]